jgi:hypothetical protein
MSISVDRILRSKATLGGARISLEIISGGQVETIECSYEMAPRLVQAIQQTAVAAEALRKSVSSSPLEIVHAHKAIDARPGTTLDGQMIVLRFPTENGTPLEVSMSRTLAKTTIERLAAELRKPPQTPQSLS